MLGIVQRAGTIPNFAKEEYPERFEVREGLAKLLEFRTSEASYLMQNLTKYRLTSDLSCLAT